MEFDHFILTIYLQVAAEVIFRAVRVTTASVTRQVVFTPLA